MTRSFYLAATFGLSAVWCLSADCRVCSVDELDLSGSYNGRGMKTGVRQSVQGTPLKVAGQEYSRGVGMRAEGAIGIRLDGDATDFTALVGVDDCATEMKHGSRKVRMVFKVWTDGKIAWTSPVLEEGSCPVEVKVGLSGVREMFLETSTDAPWVAFDGSAGDWLDARITLADDAKVETITDPEATRQLGILTPPEKPEPRINGADIWGVRPGRPVIFRIATSGERPMSFSAKGVPEGLALDAERGVLSGVAPQRKGSYDIEVTAESAKGKAVRTIRLAVGDTITLTPPMGWNSWNIWGDNLTEGHVRAAARALDESGLGDHGWSYVNMDESWQMNNSAQNKTRPELRGPARDADGRILPNPTFPDMRKLADYIHSLGFHAGLYSSPGPRTCGGHEGSYGHEAQDAASWAEWGYDYIKYDWCSYDEVLAPERGGKIWCEDSWRYLRCESKEIPYRLMRDCLRKQKRDIVYSFCQYGMGQAQEWVRETGANCWRCWEDMKDTWPWMLKSLEADVGADNHWKYAGPGCWPDLDMMIVGDQKSFGSTHPTFLTPNEQYTHVSLWCMLGSPLLIGCDLSKLDPFTRNLLVNDEVLAVSQDRLGKVARRYRHTDAEDVWMRPLTGKFSAIALVNRSPFTRKIRVTFEELGLDGDERWVMDLWRQKCEGRHAGFYSAIVPPHATKLVKTRPTDCPRCDDEAERAKSVSWDHAEVRGTLSPEKLAFRPGEKMRFELSLAGVEGTLPANTYFLDWERRGDDGKVARGREPLPLRSGSFPVETSMDVPGFVCIEANVVTADGKKVPKKHRWEKRVFFMGGAAVEPWKLKSAAEPEDFDAFWRETREKLDALPMDVLSYEKCVASNGVDVFAVKVACPGPCPLTGYLTVPATANEGKRYPANVWFDGAGTTPQGIPSRRMTDRIGLFVNTQGYDLGKDKAYYEAFFRSRCPHGTCPYDRCREQNKNRRTAFVYGLAMRAIRAVDYVSTLESCDGTVFVEGDSQGAFQAAIAAAQAKRTPDRLRVGILWGLDWSGMTLGRLPSYYRATPGYESELDYFDPCLHARRMKCPVEISKAGLGDYCSPPSSLTVFYNNLKVPRRIVYYQGSTHGWWPEGVRRYAVTNGEWRAAVGGR